MTRLEQIQRGIDYIEAHLHEPIDLTRVSRIAGISHAHFQRTFKALTGETLKGYVRARRMAHALELLLSTDLRVLDVALAAGYESQESFARAFKKAYGSTPSEYRAEGRARFLTKVRLDQAFLAHLERGVTLEPEVRWAPAMELVGVRTEFYGPESDKNNLGEVLPALWDRFLPRLSEIEPHRSGTGYGVVRQSAEDPERLTYDAAVEAPGAPPPDGMVPCRVPEGTWAVFTHRGLARDVDHTVNYVYATWLLRNDVEHTGGPDLEVYGPAWHATSPTSVMFYAVPVAG